VWSFLHKLASPRWFYEITGKLLPWVAVIAGALLLTGTVWGLAFAPQDYQQGNSFRIMYIHVPASILAESSYMMMATVGAISIIWKIKLADVAMQCAAPIGASFTFLSLTTGAIWGKPTWGTWWVWDARLTSMLLLLFLFIGVIVLRSAMAGKESAGKACAVLALVGMVNIPIIKYSVDWWFTLHQSSSFSMTEKPAMPVEMWAPLVLMIFGYYAAFFSFWMMRIKKEILSREVRTEWVRDLIRAAPA